MLASTLVQVLAGSVSAAEAIERVLVVSKASGDSDRELREVYHTLIHYRDDEDIRGQDEQYAERQRRILGDWIERLKQ